ncbi:MAG TPA: SDR family oxidoreductase, partial [Achromobacter sp.]|nr:SDR family oxidoreductase [Achromobacter sp.]
VEARLRDDARIQILINNAGAAQTGNFVAQTPQAAGQLVALNTT